MPIRKLFAICVALLLPGFVGAEEASKPPEWDQAKVTKLAQQLSTQVNAVRVAFRRVPTPSVASMQAHGQHQLRDQIRLINNECKFLAKELAAGNGQEETLSVFRRIERLRRDAADNARRLMISGEVIVHITEARETLEELAEYYEITIGPRGVEPRESGDG